MILNNKIYIIFFLSFFMIIILTIKIYAGYKSSYTILAYKIKIEKEEIQEKIKENELNKDEKRYDDFIIEIHR